jgi:hypothetical protein
VKAYRDMEVKLEGYECVFLNLALNGIQLDAPTTFMPE